MNSGNYNNPANPAFNAYQASLTKPQNVCEIIFNNKPSPRELYEK